MSKKYKDKDENDFYEYKDDTDFSVYDEDLEESVRESRRARREAKQRRKVKTANKVKPTPQESIQELIPETEVLSETEIAADDAVSAVNEGDENIKLKSTRKKRIKNGKKVKVAEANIPTERPKKKKKGFLKKLMSLAFFFVFVYALVVAGMWGWNYYQASQGEPWPDPEKNILPGIPAPAVPHVPDRTIALLMVTDEDKTRTDSMMLANYDNVNKKLTLVSIPRDIMVEVTDENFRIMRSEYPEPSADGQVMKMNHIHHFGGENHGVELLLSEIKHHFDVVPDYWVKIDFDGFNYVVDSIGGVDFDVPMDMNYEDPSQDLYIHLKAGQQHLDGDKAQQLVRFRKDNYGGGYRDGDIERLKVQQAFMKAFMEKALSADVIFKNLTNYMTAFQKYVTTNATISDMARYASVLKQINMSNVETLTLPCVPSPEYGEYVLSEDEARRMIYNVFKKPLDEVKKDIETEAAEADLEKSDDKTITVLNGGYTDGMAREVQARFNEKGIEVAQVGTYNDGKPENTVIYTSRDGIGLDLVKFFYNGAEVKTDTAVTEEYESDIVVIIGINEPLEEGGQVETSESEESDESYSNEEDDDETYYEEDDDEEYYYDEDEEDYDYDEEDEDYD